MTSEGKGETLLLGDNRLNDSDINMAGFVSRLLLGDGARFVTVWPGPAKNCSISICCIMSSMLNACARSGKRMCVSRFQIVVDTSGQRVHIPYVVILCWEKEL